MHFDKKTYAEALESQLTVVKVSSAEHKLPLSKCWKNHSKLRVSS